MSYEDIHVYDYGWVAKLTVMQDQTAVDVSTYTVQYLFTAPDGTVIARSGDFTTDGTDGAVEYTIADGDIDQVGKWRLCCRLTSGSATLTTSTIDFYAMPRVEEPGN